MSAWKEVRLGDISICMDNKRVPLNSLKRATKKGSIPYWGANGIIDYIDDYLFNETIVLLAEDGGYFNEFKDRPIANISYGKCWVNNHAHVIKAIEGITTNEYLYYSLRHKNIIGHISGTTREKLNKSDMLQIGILLPTLPEQIKIAGVLSSFDDKIDLLHRQNKTLEQMAETLFRQWFVVEADERWEYGTLGDIVSVKGGATPSTKNNAFWNGDIHWTTPKDLSNNSGSIYMLDTLRKITQKGLDCIGSGLLPVGTLLLSSRAPIGYLAFSEIPVAINQGYIAIIDNKDISKHWIYLWLKKNMDYVKSHANGSTFQEISKSSFKSLEIIKPPKTLITKFDNTVNPMFDKIKANQKQIRTLKSLRDTLLPKLISGQVRLRNH